MTHIWVQPGGSDRRVPVEGLRGVYFDHDTPRQVRDTDYVRRRLSDGDLVQVDAPAPQTEPGPAEEHA